MSEEVKCDCKEKAIKKVKEFLVISGGVFVGATLAILVSASLLKPKCPPPPMGMMPPRPGFERQLPPPMMYGHGQFPNRYGCPCRCKCHRHKHFKGEFRPQNPDFRGNKGDFPQGGPAGSK